MHRLLMTAALLLTALLVAACQVLTPSTRPAAPSEAGVAPAPSPVLNPPLDRADAWEDVWEALRRRPVRLPAATAGDPCPASPLSHVVQSQVKPDAAYRGFGPGPVYPVAAEPVVRVAPGAGRGSWHYAKVLWLSAPVYSGPALIRGRQVGGPNAVVFGWREDGGPPPTELRFPVWTGVTTADIPTGYRQQPSEVGFRVPGCYAVQVDGINFSLLVVFPVVFDPPP